MKLTVVLWLVVPRYVFAIVNVIINDRPTCESLLDCLSSNSSNTVCYHGQCVPCRSSGDSCTSATHCCSGSRCYRYRCTPLYRTGQACRLSRECLDTDDFCLNQICTRCLPLYSACSTTPLSTPCCVGKGICRLGICQPARREKQTCTNSFECADELMCLSGRCQNPLGGC